MAPAQRKASYDDNVFLNVPFDNRYSELFRALVFAVHDCGFNARCALEADNSADVRVEKLYRIIRECRFGIHDISRTSLDRVSKLPRFNMPLELGLFLGAKAYGGPTQRSKSCLVLEALHLLDAVGPGFGVAPVVAPRPLGGRPAGLGGVRSSFSPLRIEGGARAALTTGP